MAAWAVFLEEVQEVRQGQVMEGPVSEEGEFELDA